MRDIWNVAAPVLIIVATANIPARCVKKFTNDDVNLKIVFATASVLLAENNRFTKRTDKMSHGLMILGTSHLNLKFGT